VPAERTEYVTLARILRPRGTRGEVAAEILTDFPERLTRLREVFLSDGKSALRPARVVRAWLSHSRGGQAIFHFEGCDSIEVAEKLRGLEVQVPLAERVALPAGRYYVTDLVGCEVHEIGGAAPFGRVDAGKASSGIGDAGKASLGIVRDVQFSGEAVGTPLLVVETARGELLIPLAEEICRRIDIAARLIEVALPEGLRELNRE
jgi:16S rRNA processing protein RimM